MSSIRSILVVLLVTGTVAACAQVDEGATRSTERSADTIAAPRPFSTTWTGRAAPSPVGFDVDAHGTVTVGEAGHVVALDRAGATTWTVAVGDGPLEHDPALIGAIVVVPTSAGVVALDRSHGAQRWTARAPGAAVAGGSKALIASATDGSIVRLDPSTGSELWRTAVAEPDPNVAPWVTLTPHAVIAGWGAPGSCCRVQVLDLATGAARWERDVAPASTPPVTDGESVYIAEALGEDARESRVRSLRVTDGAVEWSIRIPGLFQPRLVPDLDGRELVVIDAAGVLTMLDTADGRIRWRSEPTYPQDRAAPALAGDRVFVAAFETIFVGLDRRTGRVLGSAPPEPPVFLVGLRGLASRAQLLVTSRGLGAVWNLEQEPTS